MACTESGSTEFRQSSLPRFSESASLPRDKPALTLADRRDPQGGSRAEGGVHQSNNNRYKQLLRIQTVQVSRTKESKMQVNGVQVEDDNGLGVSQSFEMSSLIVNEAANDQDHEDSRATALLHDPPPPLGVKLTGYRLLFMSVVFVSGIAKAILSYMGQSVGSTTLEWVAGVVLTIFLFWLGLYEPIRSSSWEWFFHVDLIPAIRYCFLRFLGGVLGVLFTLHGTFAISSLSSIPLFLLAHFFPSVTREIWKLVYICFTLCVHFSWLKTWGLRSRLRVRRYATGFLQLYGLGASLLKQHEWSGTVGITMGFFCGIAVVSSPLCFMYFSGGNETYS